MKPNETSPARLWAQRTILALIVTLIISVIAATIVGFWLSYAGLHAFAFRAGLRGPEAWAWPASVDLFILAGELGVTISAVRGKNDRIAWAYLLGGAALSVLFNIVHVWLHPVWWGRYAVAAVPPVAAMLALAALLRQVVKGVATSGDTVPSRGPTDAETLAEERLRDTWLAGNALSQNQLVTDFRLTRAEAKKLYDRVIPKTPAAAAPAPSPPGDGQPPRLAMPRPERTLPKDTPFRPGLPPPTGAVMTEPGAELVPQPSAVPMDTHYEVALDEVPEPAPPVPVDPAVPFPVLADPGERKQIVPAPLRSLEAFRLEASRVAGREWHRTRWHGFRSPVYLARWVCWALAGLLKVIGRQLAWWWVADHVVMSREAVEAKDPAAWLRVQTHVREVRLTRGSLLAGEFLGLAAAAVFMYRLAPWWAWPFLGSFLLVMFARVGKPAGKPVITPAVVSSRFRVLRADIVLRAYYAAKLGHPEKPGEQVTFGSSMSRDGEGTSVLVDLPHGKGLKDAIEAKEKIASGLDVTESQVFIRRDPTSYRRHTLWVADRDPLAVPVGRTPLLACRQTDIWKAAPMGLDERGQLVSVLLMWISVLIGALPRQGKTFAARLLALYAALDPYVQMGVFDGKGSPDWRKFALVAESFAFGLTPTREGLPPEILLGYLEELKRDVQERYHRLSDMDPKVCPEGKLTRQIARDPRFGMPVRVLVLDEFQEYFDLGEISKDIAAHLVFLQKVAPGAGVGIIASTQKPSGIGTGQIAQQFTSMRDNMAVRFGLRTSSWQVSEMVLGQGAYSEGLDTSTLLPQYKGVGILRGATDASPTVRTYLADGQDAEKILIAARSIRERAGTLSGMAAGQTLTPEARDVLGDVLNAFGADPGLHWGALAERLTAAFPARWEGATADSVSAECRAAGVASVTVKVAGLTLRGCRLEDVRRAAAE